MSSDIHTVAHGDHSRIVQVRQAVLRNADEWRALWAEHTGPDLPAPEVDFHTRMVAAVFAGERPSPGYDVAISGVRQDGAEWVLLVDERRPAEGTLSAQVTTTPFHIVSLQRYEGRVEFADARTVRAPRAAAGAAAPRRRHHEAAPSSTGLTPPVAGSLAYMAGPFSGALLLATETSSRFVRFHAWQALVGLGAIGTVAFLFLALAFLMLLFSPTLFWAMLWLAASAAVVWIVLWAICLVQAYRGRLWKIPLAGSFAERRAGLRT
jgi:uncharacterized membrane protein